MSSSDADRVVVGVSGSLGNLAALHVAVAEARRRGVPLVAVHAWSPIGGELAYCRAPCAALLRIWRLEAKSTLERAFRDAFGDVPTDLPVQLRLVRGEPGKVLLAVADQPGDLLVLGAGQRGRLRRLRGRGVVTRYVLGRATCPVQSVAQPELIDTLRSARRTSAGRLARSEFAQLTAK